jgi:CIC family chloride channel protein
MATIPVTGYRRFGCIRPAWRVDRGDRCAGIEVGVLDRRYVSTAFPFIGCGWPAIGAIRHRGGPDIFAPHTMGVGYDNIRWLLQGTAPLAVIATLGILKYVSWSISLGSGTSGGDAGAVVHDRRRVFGAILGGLVLQLFPLSHINIATAALIGMAAMFAGASRAWLTSIVFALETTGQINGLLPLLGACLAALFRFLFS